MTWQIAYALEYLRSNYPSASVEHIGGDAIRITLPEQPPAVAIISEASAISAQLAAQYLAQYPEMAFLCGYRKECVWEGGAIELLERSQIGWGSASTLNSAINRSEMRSASHKDYFFSYRLIRQIRAITNLNREFDRVFTMTLSNGRAYRVGMITDYEPTADAVRTFWDRFGPVNVLWSINPNGRITTSAVEAARSLGCTIVKWEELKSLWTNS